MIIQPLCRKKVTRLSREDAAEMALPAAVESGCDVGGIGFGTLGFIGQNANRKSAVSLRRLQEPQQN
jgi:hypothetical protein